MNSVSTVMNSALRWRSQNAASSAVSVNMATIAGEAIHPRQRKRDGG
jgi:hypothetical protein